ncbi:MAG: MIP family channel protein [Saprospiraceae bacterium]|nr:MIP family channel protein [Saprospiraceae bacterium]
MSPVLRIGIQKSFAELIGTFALVFCGTGAIIINQESGGVISHIGIAITFGLIVMAMIYALGNVSGAHLNPAVSLAFWVAGRFPANQIPAYLMSQLAGALLASGLLHILFPDNATLGATLPAGTALQSFVLELILTFILMLVILQVSQGSKETGWFAGLAIGGVVLLEAMFAGPVCGASMNPARSLAPALVSGHLEHVWIYLSAPVLGAMLAVPCRAILHMPVSILNETNE